MLGSNYFPQQIGNSVYNLSLDAMQMNVCLKFVFLGSIVSTPLWTRYGTSAVLLTMSFDPIWYSLCKSRSPFCLFLTQTSRNPAEDHVTSQLVYSGPVAVSVSIDP